ncbi:MAG: hypothetical protein QOE70_3300 [Chthoniobacter sp.]|jgi:hypothetical protein|nr:hypothetical protein [Chthoniobacter sp.]
MKKLIPAGVLLLVLAAAALFFLKLRRYLPEAPRGAELAPAETIFFAQLPNLRRSALRFPQTSLYKIWQEPEMQAFLEKPRQKVPWMRLWQAKCDQIARVAPGEVFVAVTSIEGPAATFVAGFSFAGDPADAEALLAEPRAEFKRHWPAGKSDISGYKGRDIETFTYAQGELASCFNGRWFFLANDLALLRATLDRAENPAGALAGSLAGNPIFQQASAPLGTALDAMLYGQLTSLTDRLGSLAAASGRAMEAGQIAAFKKNQAIAAGAKIDGTQLRDTIFILSPGTAPQEPLPRNTLAFSGAQTLLYFATGAATLLQLPDSLGLWSGLLPGFAAKEEALAAEGLKWKDLERTFGPELGSMVDWPDEASVPTLLVMLEVRDRERARRFVETLTAGGIGNPGWTRQQKGGVATFQAPLEGFPFVQPTIALSGEFALFGLNSAVVTGALSRLPSGNGGLRAMPAFSEASRLVSEPTAAFGYLDSQKLFDHAYGILRPFITMSLAFSPDTGSYIDAGKLPSAGAVSKHLSPSVLSQSTAKNGTLIESAGTLTFDQLLLASIGWGVAAALPTAQNFLSPAASPSAPADPQLPPSPQNPDLPTAPPAPVPASAQSAEPAEHK